MRGNLPLLIIMQEIDFGTPEDPVIQSFDDVYKDFKNINFDFMVFDNTYQVSNMVAFLFLFFKLETLIVQHFI